MRSLGASVHLGFRWCGRQRRRRGHLAALGAERGACHAAGAIPVQEIGLVAVAAMALYMLLAIVSYSAMDPAWSFDGTDLAVSNWVGRSGAYTADIALLAFGWGAYLLPTGLGAAALLLLRPAGRVDRPPAQAWSWAAVRVGGFVATLVSVCVLLRLHQKDAGHLPAGTGGALGDSLANLGLPVLNPAGLTLCALAVLLIGSQAAIGYSWLQLAEWTGRGLHKLAKMVSALARASRRPATRAATFLWVRLRPGAAPREHVAATDAAAAPPVPAAGRDAEARAKPQARSRPVEPTVGVFTPQLGPTPAVAKTAPDPTPTETPTGTAANPTLDAEQSAALGLEPSSAEREGPAPRMEAPAAGEREGLAPRMKAPAAGEREGQRVVGETPRGEPPAAHAPAPRTPPAEANAPPAAGAEPDEGPALGLPGLDLLEDYDRLATGGYSAASLEAMSRLLEEKLADFKVQAEVVSVQPGPVVTRFELQPAAGVKVSKITGLAKDLARSLAVISVRIVEIIPGKSVVGIEIPNEKRETVRLKEILASKQFEQAASPLTLALGKDIAGVPVMADIGRMPHLLVAGTTGSGKSVGVNAMLLSMLYKAAPTELRLILVDPKMLELAVYEGIPHLLTPVVTDMKDAAQALNWCVAEMERRYQLMASLGVRNIGGFNKRVLAGREQGSPVRNPLWPEDAGQPAPEPSAGEREGLAHRMEELAPLPYIVVVIDEFADMMMIVGKKVEQLIARIAQKARAAGIHLVLATQRPSVDVITGLIKANIPARLSFQVSSRVDSRTILDQGGAEQLLGHGDMLFLPPGTSVPERVHGAFVADEEVHAVCTDWKARAGPDYLAEVVAGGVDTSIPGTVDLTDEAKGGGDDKEPLYEEAVAFVLESRRASISSVQRKLRIGYNRAARLIEAMEEAGVVSAMDGQGNREVLARGAAVAD